MSSSQYHNPYSSFLLKVEKPARYTGGEHFIVRKPWTDEMVKVALCFPEVYEIGMSFLGYKILYKELNKEKNVLAERVFAPWVDMEKMMRELKTPLVSLETFRPLCDFDVIGFSLQYEMTYSNILNMLDLGGVPIRSVDRSESDPFVTAGGPCATHPEPVSDFIDFFIIGDGEGLFVETVTLIKKLRQEGVSRLEILLQLATLNGVYVPRLYRLELDEESGFEIVGDPLFPQVSRTVARNIVANINDYPFPVDAPIPHATAIFDKFSVELARGCTEGCRFCQAGMIYRPVRERDPKIVEETIMKGIKIGGFDEASLAALSTADYSAITPLATSLLDKMGECDASLGIASLRAYGLDDKVLDKLAQARNGSLTFAPEAGSERMRKVINKNISEEDIIKNAHKVFSRGWSKMKLYFMIGLPTETDEDVAEIMETGRKIRKVAQKENCSKPQITISVSTFVPKPHTPFQWSPMDRMPDVQRKQTGLWEMAKDYRLNFRKHVSSVSQLESVMSRGDRAIGRVIEKAWQLGARFDGWSETFNEKIWEQAFVECGIDREKYLATIRVDSKLPWDHIDVGVTKEYLVAEWKRAVANRNLKPCGKPVGQQVHFKNLADLTKYHDDEKKKLICYHCGVQCNLGEMVAERKVFLKEMKAEEREEYVPVDFTNKNTLSFREKRGQNIGYKYRMRYSKLGALSFLSHLDLQKIIARIFRRAEMKVLYSEGFHKRPLIAFGPALPLGINSKSEYLDVRMENKIEGEDIEKTIQLLQACGEPGLKIYDMKWIEKEETSIQESIKEYRYFFGLQSENSEDEILGTINQFLTQSEVWVEEDRGEKRAKKVKNIREMVREMKFDLYPDNDSEDGLIHEVSPVLGKKGLEIVASVVQGVSVRPNDLVGHFAQLGIKLNSPVKLETVF